MVIYNTAISLSLDKVCDGKYNVINNDSKEVIDTIYTKTDISAVTALEKRFGINDN
jgi:hypothetical protein